jgi:uncharacterized membrane protein
MSKPVSGQARAVVLFLDRTILWVSRHWLGLLNTCVGLYVALPLLAPVLIAAGWPGGALTFSLYRVACHQYPERSWFIFGEQMAYCQRDTALYGGIFLLGLAFAATRLRWRPLPLLPAILLATPMAVDGTLQLFGAYESTWLLRTVTGILAALAVVWFLYPRFQKAFAETGELAAGQLERAESRDRGLL